MKKKQYKPFIIKSNNPNQGLFDSPDRLEFSKHIIKTIKYVIENKISNIIVAHHQYPGVGGLYISVPLMMEINDYSANLDFVLKILEEYEEYELCSEILNLKQQLQTVNFTQETNIVSSIKNI